MLLIDCPYCGKRPELEFTHGGQAHLVRPSRPAEIDDQAWADFLYMRTNTKGIHAERWRHARGCGRFFNALRDTTTDHFLATYRAGEPAPPLEVAGSGPQSGATRDAGSARDPGSGPAGTTGTGGGTGTAGGTGSRS